MRILSFIIGQVCDRWFIPCVLAGIALAAFLKQDLADIFVVSLVLQALMLGALTSVFVCSPEAYLREKFSNWDGEYMYFMGSYMFAFVACIAMYFLSLWGTEGIFGNDITVRSFFISLMVISWKTYSVAIVRIDPARMIEWRLGRRKGHHDREDSHSVS